ncbi:MAG: ADP-ribosylglycohydrolase family protein, partial [Spirochaetales bacterium]|nr:ADP-ribosylglycohydrolase family protein [Spirochaetales bacterium]
DSQYARLCREVMDFYDNDREKNWRSCMQFLIENYGYDKYPGNCHIIPNAGVVFLSLLYGEGDFSRTQLICNMCGWDTDCNAGNVGAIVGVLVGMDGIEDKWIRPINDLLISSSVVGGLNIDTVSATALMFCKIGYRLRGEDLPAMWKPRVDTKDRIIHFDLEKSTGSVRTLCSDGKSVCKVENSLDRSWEGHRSLHIYSERPMESDSVFAYVKTYYKPEDLHDSRYDPAFTPNVFPGQTMICRLCNNGADPIEASIRVKDFNGKRDYISEPVTLGDEWTVLEYRIPALKGALIKEAGILLKTLNKDSNRSNLHVHIDEIRWTGSPDYTVDFSRECLEFYGYGGGTLHREISQMTYLNGLWELDGSWLSGSCHKEGESYTGLFTAENYEVSSVLMPVSGFCHLMNFRVQGGARSYAFGFYGEGKVALLKKDISYSILESGDYSFEAGKKYPVKIIADRERFRLYLDDIMIFDYKDRSPTPYLYGQVGFTVLERSHCHYKDLRFKGIDS